MRTKLGTYTTNCVVSWSVFNLKTKIRVDTLITIILLIQSTLLLISFRVLVKLFIILSPLFYNICVILVDPHFSNSFISMSELSCRKSWIIWKIELFTLLADCFETCLHIKPKYYIWYNIILLLIHFPIQTILRVFLDKCCSVEYKNAC